MKLTQQSQVRATVVVVTIALLGFACSRGEEAPAGAALENQQVREWIEQGAKIVDVRSQAEFDSGSYPNAIHIPVDEIGARSAELGAKGQRIVLFCGSGKRSGRALGILQQAGFQNLINAGGLRDMPR